MSDSSAYYSEEVLRKRDMFFHAAQNNDGITNVLINMIVDTIKIYKKDISILDLGTGNGYLISEVYKRTSNGHRQLSLIGIDASQKMIDAASIRNKNLPIVFKKMDNNYLKFKDATFDIVIAKAVSNLSCPEIIRVLKQGGWFIYKEYDKGRGLVEIMEQIPNICTSSGLDIYKDLKINNLRYLEIRKYFIPILRNIDEVVSILDTMRILPENLSKDAIKELVKTLYKGKKWKKIHSDPYIIIAQK